MTGKSVKDIDRYQIVLNSLLAREENKFCADCESKGPRWASWNLGIFICIRCAGIHRNLGVHISRVKSVNLDQWTQQQVQCVQELGNAKAKRLYEAFLPECFQRPETDHSAEIFIRDKYDKKKYMDKVIDIQMLRKERSCDNIPKEPVVFEKMKLKKEMSPKTQSQSVIDLLGLDTPGPSPAVSNGGSCVQENRQCPVPANPGLAESALDLFNSPTVPSSLSSSKTTPASNAMPRSRVAASVPENLSLFLDTTPQKGKETFKKLSKDSILSLYRSAPSVHASSMAAQAGLYRNQMGYPTHPYGSFHSLAQVGGPGSGAMMTSQMAMMGQQQNAMMGQQQSPMMGQQQNAMMGQQQNAMMVHQQNAMMGVQQSGMMGHQQVGGLMAGLHHQQVQHAQQQQQWNIPQMTQHVAGMNFYRTNSPGRHSDQHMPGPTASSSAHMAAHVWK